MSNEYERYWYAWITVHHSKSIFSRTIMGPYSTEEAATYAAHRRVGWAKTRSNHLRYSVEVCQNMPWY
nr:MAG TPA: hypothetical protein [Caudoviricetes sp.]